MGGSASDRSRNGERFFSSGPEEKEDESVLHLPKEDTFSNAIREVSDIQYVSESQSADNLSNRKLDR